MLSTRAGRRLSGPVLDSRAYSGELSHAALAKVTMDDERRFELYRLAFVESRPDSGLRDALIEVIKHKLKMLDARSLSEAQHTRRDLKQLF